MSLQFAVELFCLGIDAVVCVLLFKTYSGILDTIQNITDAPILSLDDDLSELVSSSPTAQRLPYVIVRGHVQPIGAALVSQFSHDKTLHGVIQRVTVIEHGKQFSSGFWTRNKEIIHSFVNAVSFGLSPLVSASNSDASKSPGATNATAVEITDWRQAVRLDMDVTYDHFEQSPMYMAAQILVWSRENVVYEGIETTEEMLLQNTLLTVIGEVALEDGQVRLRPPVDGKDYFLVKGTYQSLIKELQNNAEFYKFLLMIFGSLGLLLLGYIGHGYWRKLQIESISKTNERTLKNIKKERKEMSIELAEDDVCCVCLQNPQEVKLTPCGHKCLCADCASSIIKSKPICPMCRTEIHKVE